MSYIPIPNWIEREGLIDLGFQGFEVHMEQRKSINLNESCNARPGIEQHRLDDFIP